MIYVAQSLRSGATEIGDAPVPATTVNTLVVQTRASVISPGTERMLLDFGRAGWLGKARSQPEKLAQLIDKARTDGLTTAIEIVRSKLDAPLPLGYCQAGVVEDVGRNVTRFAPGDRVVTNGPHAEYVRVPETLSARIPDSVSFEVAAFTPLAAIALQGLRLANPTLGETVVVYGLGTIGLLAVQLARATGCNVVAIDRLAHRCSLAEKYGATAIVAEDGVDLSSMVIELTGGIGADIVLLTLSTRADEPLHQAAAMSRKRGRIVLVGVTGLDLRRDDFYRKELSFQVSCSYGPGRYDPVHEQAGLDYPLPFVRWTEARNFSAALRLMADGRLDPVPLISHRFPIEQAGAAYDLIASNAASLGVVLNYNTDKVYSPSGGRTVTRKERMPNAGKPALGFIGAGNFALRVLIPAFKKAGASLDMIVSTGGLSAAIAGQQHGFRRLTSDAEVVITDTTIKSVVVATRHDSHADWVVRALNAGKNVFVEKPLALKQSDLSRIAASLDSSSGILCVGFNRRFAPHIAFARNSLSARQGPAVISITVNAGCIPEDHWAKDPHQGGGRIVGEACHFVDLCRFLVGSPIADLQVVTARRRDGEVIDDISLLQLAFADGSIGTIQYFANASKRYPKERVEVFFDNKALRVDNLRAIRVWGMVGPRQTWHRGQNKGHLALVEAFLKAIHTGTDSPIPEDQILEVSAFSIAAAQLARKGGGTVRASELELARLDSE